MIVMPSNNGGFDCGRLFGKYPHRMAHLMTPDNTKEPRPSVKWALDNGVFGAWSKGREWSQEPFYNYLDAWACHSPEWVVVPDWVADKDKTIALWHKHISAIQCLGLTPAFVVQDGMTPKDVPSDAQVIFVGGSTSWKWRNLKTWTNEFERVHVGRVNTYQLCWQAMEAGAESCDGTGWFRHPKRTEQLEKFLEDSEKENPQLNLNI
jgi:hypothetical protein